MNLRSAASAALLAVLLMPAIAWAGPYDDLLKAQSAFQNAKSWHADELLSNGKTVTVDYSAPDRWRIQPNPDMQEVIIGNDVYMIRKGRSTKLPFGGSMIRKTAEEAGFSVQEEVKDTAQDLGMQTVDGQSLHAYSFTAKGTPVTLYLGADSLPVESVTKSSRGTVTVKYSKYNQPIDIEAQ
ncbi:MAG TPA: hypothetical protein VGS10_02685 [Terracidiphilus sp.]|nr:hypothetical protein [Terracidiphilus sp.]